MSRTLRLAAVLLVLVAPSLARATDYKGLYEALEPVAKLKDLPYLVPVVKVVPKDPAVKPASVVFTIVSRDGPVVVKPRADGTIDFPLTAGLLAENPPVENSLGKGQVGVGVSIEVRAPPATRFDYRVIADMKAQWDEAVRRQKMMWRLLAPGAKSALIVFAPGTAASAQVQLPEGAKSFAADAAGNLRLPIDEGWAKLNPPVVLSAMPLRIALDFRQ